MTDDFEKLLQEYGSLCVKDAVDVVTGKGLSPETGKKINDVKTKLLAALTRPLTPNVPTEPGDYYVTFRARIEDNRTQDTDAPDYIILNSEVFPFLIYTREVTAHFERIEEES